MPRDKIYWSNFTLYCIMSKFTAEDAVNADLEGLTVDQYRFNKWYKEIESTRRFDKYGKDVELAWWKCWLWALLPSFLLGVNDSVKFRGWKIGHCLNCDASPYDGKVEAWSYGSNFYRGALIRCSKCGQLRWQSGESGLDY